jgi:cbb3-type cytochrome oxidase subunit 3
MGAIAKQFFLASPVLDYPLIALATFMLVFVAITVRALMQERRGVDAAARLPLADAPREGHEHE